YDRDNADTKRLIAETEEKIKDIIRRAQEKEKAPETVALTLPAEEKAAEPPVVPPPAAAPAPPPAAPKPVAPKPAAPVEPPEAVHTRARKLLNDGKLAEAIEQFTIVLKQNPSHALAYNGRGYAQFRLKRYADAIADFDQAIRLNPSYANAYLNRSAAKRASGDKAGADADLAKSKELSK